MSDLALWLWVAGFVLMFLVIATGIYRMGAIKSSRNYPTRAFLLVCGVLIGSRLLPLPPPFEAGADYAVFAVALFFLYRAWQYIKSYTDELRSSGMGIEDPALKTFNEAMRRFLLPWFGLGLVYFGTDPFPSFGVLDWPIRILGLLIILYPTWVWVKMVRRGSRTDD